MLPIANCWSDIDLYLLCLYIVLSRIILCSVPPSAVAAAVIKDVADHGKKDLKHVPAPQDGLSQAEKEAYLQEKGKK